MRRTWAWLPWPCFVSCCRNRRRPWRSPTAASPSPTSGLARPIPTRCSALRPLAKASPRPPTAWANATGDAPFGFNALGFGTLTGASAVNLPGFQNVPGIQNAASSQGQGSFSGILTVTGGTGSVDVTFSLDVAGLLHGFADAAGQFGTETIAALDLDGSNVLFRHDVMSGGPNFPDTTITVSKNLTAALPLEFGGSYFLFIQADSESSARNIPEPGTLVLTLLGLAGLARARRGAAGRAPHIPRRA